MAGRALRVCVSVYVNLTREMVTHRRDVNSVTSWHFHFRKDVQFSCGWRRTRMSQRVWIISLFICSIVRQCQWNVICVKKTTKDRNIEAKRKSKFNFVNTIFIQNWIWFILVGIYANLSISQFERIRGITAIYKNSLKNIHFNRCLERSE